MEKKTIPLINEEISYTKLSNGLLVCILENKNFDEYYANYTTKFGSNNLVINDKELPFGIAHYLEHLMFNSPTGDAFYEFSKNNANPNAYTSYNQTSYLFSCYSKFEENLISLINMVQTPYFTDELVEKEYGIIKEEILMYDQLPEWKIRNYKYEAICKKTNYKYDIAGTTDSIKKINSEILNEVYNKFYNPQNQMLVVAGNFENIDVIDILDNSQQIKSGYQINEEIKIETSEVNYEEKEYEGEKNLAAYTIKFTQNNEVVKNNIALRIVKNYLFSSINNDYNMAIENNHINELLSIEVISEVDILYMCFNFQQQNLDQGKKFVDNQIENMDILDMKNSYKKIIGQEIKRFDNLQGYCNLISSLYVKGLKIEEYYKIVNEITLEDMKILIEKLFLDYKKNIIKIKSK